jgi:hypothetical protein
MGYWSLAYSWEMISSEAIGKGKRWIIEGGILVDSPPRRKHESGR